MAVYKKYGIIGGDPEYRKKKWHEWWDCKGKFKCSFVGSIKPIRKPPYSADLAEFVGIILGDGCITQRQVTITLHDELEKDYGKFFVSLAKKLFNVRVGTYHKNSAAAVNYIISRSELVRFCIEKLGLKRGNKVKQKVDIPDWIKRNSNYSIACLRGLVDTDGCVFVHRYKVNGKWYIYKKLAFASYSAPLLCSAATILKKAGLHPRFARKGKIIREIRIDSKNDMKKYFRIIGSHHSGHLKKYQK